MTFHDLRATGITWAAIRGDDALKIMARSGHTEYGTMMIYVREAEVIRENFGDVFPELPEALVGIAHETPKRPNEAPKRPTTSGPLRDRNVATRATKEETPRRTDEGFWGRPYVDEFRTAIIAFAAAA